MITLKQEPIFSLCLNGNQLPGFRVTSEWEGFKKLERGGEYVVVATTKVRGPFTEAFNEMFGGFLLKGNPEEFFPVVASEGLAKLLASSFPNTTDAMRDVGEERRRQWTVEGFHTAHDDGHDGGELSAAASAYALAAADKLRPESQGDGGFGLTVPSMWPWDSDLWKSSTPRRDLVKAGALILAEIERLDRAAASATGSQP